MISVPFLTWLSIRLISEVICFFVQFYFKGNINSVFLVSVFLEEISIIWYYNHTGEKLNFFTWLYTIPTFFIIFDFIYPETIYKTNGLSFIFYNALATFLMLKRLITINSVDVFNRSIILALFIFHSLSFVYSMVEHLVRTDLFLMKLLYPVFLSLIVGFNSFISYYLWSARRN